MRIVAGRYIPGDSWLHTADPKAKLLSTFFLITGVVLSSSVRDYVILSGCFLVLSALSRISVVTYLKGLKNIWMLIAFAAVVQIFYGGWIEAIETAVRVSLIMLLAQVLTFTTRPVDFAYSLEDILTVFFGRRGSQEFSMVMMIAMRFAPVMLEEMDRIKKAQMARGAKIDTGPVFERMKSLVSITVPLMASAIRKSEEIAVALEVRRFKPGVKRTRYREYTWKAKEWILTLWGLIAAAAILLL